MTIVLLIILALVWAAVLVPPWLRRRQQAHPTGSIASFHQHLAVLSHLDSAGRPAGRTGARTVVPPARYYATTLSRTEARRRRRDILFTLAAAAGLTLFLAVLMGGVVIPVHLFVDALLVSYVVLLIRTQRLAAERQAKVRYLPRRPVAEPALLLRRSASS